MENIDIDDMSKFLLMQSIRKVFGEQTTEAIVSSMNEKDMARRARFAADKLRLWFEAMFVQKQHRFVVNVIMSEFVRPGPMTSHRCHHNPSTDFAVDFVLVNEDVCCTATIFIL